MRLAHAASNASGAALACPAHILAVLKGFGPIINATRRHTRRSLVGPDRLYGSEDKGLLTEGGLSLALLLLLHDVPHCRPWGWPLLPFPPPTTATLPPRHTL